MRTCAAWATSAHGAAISAPLRRAGDRVVTSLKLTNLANQEVLRHIFGAVLKRQVAGEVRLTF